jgi:predicted nucleotidyltransferase
MNNHASGAGALRRLAKNSGKNSVSNTDDSLPPSGQMLRNAFKALISTLDECRVRYAIIGGLAVAQHARGRTTDDIDALLTVPQIAMPGFFEALKNHGFEVDLMRHIRELRKGFTSVYFHGVKIDLMQPVVPAHARILDRAMESEILGKRVTVVSAEGLIVMKLMAMRPQDEADVLELLAGYGAQLDFDFIRREMETFADDSVRAKFEQWVRQTPQT